MNKPQRIMADGFFSNQPKPISKEDKVKQLLKEVAEKKSAETQLKNLLLQFRGKKSILQLLPVIKLRFSESVLKLAIERAKKNIHRKKPKGKRDEREQLEQLMELRQYEDSLAEKK